MPAGNQGVHNIGLHPRIAWNSVPDFRGGNLGCLVTRSPETPCQPASSLRSAKSGAVERATRVTGSTRASWAELLRTNQLKPVYHERHGIRALKELGRNYLTITKDVTRVMNRIKALYRSWGIPCTGTSVYAPSHRAEWLAKLVEPGVRVRAEHLYQQLDSLQP